ncbi:MAG: SDR family NAD(P)-dependent oxidoreductase [Bacteroidota bacterium]
MKKNVLIVGFSSTFGISLAKAIKEDKGYVYGLDLKEDYEGICDRAFRFDMEQFASDADYRIRFTQIFAEVIPRLDLLIICSESEGAKSLKDLRLDGWHASLNKTVTGPLLLIKLFLVSLKKSKGVVLLINTLEQPVDEKLNIAFSAANQAIRGLIKSLAIDLNDEVKLLSISLEREGPSNEEELEKCKQEAAALALYLTNAKHTLTNGADIILKCRG